MRLKEDLLDAQAGHHAGLLDVVEGDLGINVVDHAALENLTDRLLKFLHREEDGDHIVDEADVMHAGAKEGSKGMHGQGVLPRHIVEGAMLKLVNEADDSHGDIVGLLSASVDVPGAHFTHKHVSKRLNLEHVVDIIVKSVVLLHRVGA
jgi:hypothetical protein